MYDSPILVAECEAVHETILIASRKCIPQIVIQSVSQVVVKAINGKIRIPKDIINLMEDIK